MIPLSKKSGLPTHDQQLMYFLKNTRKTVVAQATTTCYELRKLLQVPVGVSEGLLHGDGTAQGDK